MFYYLTVASPFHSHLAPPVVLGHYWLESVPESLAPNIACLDYSVAKRDGKLVAYSWNGGSTLNTASFLCEPG